MHSLPICRSGAPRSSKRGAALRNGIRKITAATTLSRAQFYDHIPNMLDALHRRLESTAHRGQADGDARRGDQRRGPRAATLAAGLQRAGGHARVGVAQRVPCRRARALCAASSAPRSRRHVVRMATGLRLPGVRDERERVAVCAYAARGRRSPTAHARGCAPPARRSRAAARRSVARSDARFAREPRHRAERHQRAADQVTLRTGGREITAHARAQRGVTACAAERPDDAGATRCRSRAAGYPRVRCSPGACRSVRGVAGDGGRARSLPEGRGARLRCPSTEIA